MPDAQPPVYLASMRPQIDQLPAELLARISSLLSSEALAAFRLVCRGWSEIGLAAIRQVQVDGSGDFTVAARMPGLRVLQVHVPFQGAAASDNVDRLIAFMQKVRSIMCLCMVRI